MISFSIFSEALKLNRNDPNLASKIGKALVTTHDYVRAVSYYESALRADPSKIALVHDLADLYIHLHKYPEAARVLETAVNHPPELNANLSTLIADVQSYLLLAKVRQCAQLPDPLKAALLNAWRIQKDVLLWLRGLLLFIHFDPLSILDCCLSHAFCCRASQAKTATRFESKKR